MGLRRLQMPLGEAPLGVHWARQAVATGTVIRWIGLVVLGLVGTIEPPPSRILLAALTAWVAVYNASALLALRRAHDPTVHALARVLTFLDLVTLLALFVVFLGRPPDGLYAMGIWVMIEAMAADGAPGVAVATLAYIGGLAAIHGLPLIFHWPFSGPDLLLQILVLAVSGVCLMLVSRMSAVASLPVHDPPARDLRLTAEEIEILRLVAAGYSNAMIAARLKVSVSAARRRVGNLLARLNTRSRAEAAAVASRMRLL